MGTIERRATRVAMALLTVVLLAVACSATGTDAAAPDGGGGDGGDEPTTTTTTFQPRSFTVVGTGDILLHNNVIQQGKTYAKGTPAAYNFDPMFDQVRDLITTADLAICHQETPISADNTNLTVPRTLSFNAPKEIATAIKSAGYDGCDTASNHTYDRNAKGVKDTLDVLDSVGLQHAGSSRNQQEADTPPIYDVKGVKVGHLAYSYDIYNTAGPDTQVPPDTPWLKAMLWPVKGAAGILADAQRLRDRGAEFVVMSIHWGDQYIHQPNAQQRQLAKDVLTPTGGVDLILGDHVHVVQPCEKIGDKYVTYGMGNFLSNQSPTQDRTLVDDNQDGSLQRFTIDEVSPGQFKAVKMEYQPTWVVIPGHVVTPATPTNFKKSYDRTVANINLLGQAGGCDATPLA